jgi:CheY-like chemotaxis protein
MDPSMTHILLVEDNAADVRLTREALADAKIINELHVARDGVEALDFLRRRGEFSEAVRPDLIILDLNLPRKDGKEVISVVLHTNKPGIWDDSKLLLEHGLAKLTAPPPAPPVPATAASGQPADGAAAKEATPAQPADAPARPPGS